MSKLLTVEEAARRIGVSRWMLLDVLRAGHAPVEFERVGRQYFVRSDRVKGVMEGRRASPLVREALARVQRDRTENAVALADMAGGDPAVMWDAVREAYSGTRLARSAHSPLRRTWRRAHLLLLEARREGKLTPPRKSASQAPLSPPSGSGGSPERSGPVKRVRPPQGWVTKTDIVRYVRCPYSWWLLYRGEITFQDTIDEFQLRLLQGGNEFQALVESAATKADPAQMSARLQENVTLFGVPLLENEELKIRGQPDGIETAEGALFPIEIKSHRDVQPIDELELAFYWLLLDPYRTRHESEPRGFLILRRDGVAERVEVAIRPHRFEEVRRLLDEVRSARLRGVRPRICGCIVCSSVRREEVLRDTWSRKDLTLVFGIGRVYASALEIIGIADLDALLGCESQTVVGLLRDEGHMSISVAQVERWKRHAESWNAQTARFFGSEPCLDRDSFIALDLEYDQGGFIWLVGACVIDGDRRENWALWADDRAEEEAKLRELVAMLTAHPELPIVTWGGDGADIPRLREAAERYHLIALQSALEAGHLDLYQRARESLRLPIPGLGLKEVAGYFGIAKISSVRDGFQAEMMHQGYLRSQAENKAELRDKLIEYNRDDLEALIGVAQRMRELSRRGPASATL